MIRQRIALELDTICWLITWAVVAGLAIGVGVSLLAMFLIGVS